MPNCLSGKSLQQPMPLPFERKRRTALPRWRLFAEAAALGELDSLRLPAVLDSFPADFEQLESFRAEPTIWHAADLLGAANARRNREAAIEASRFILLHESEASASLRSAAADTLLGAESASEQEPLGNESVVRDRIRAVRTSLNHFPNDAVRWADFALLHVSVGQDKAAERGLRISLALAPENRFILRSAARAFCIRQEPERAHWLLLKSSRLRQDPWLLSAELAVSTILKRKSRFIGVGRDLVADDNFRPRDRSELASGLGTLEGDAGSRGRANRLFRLALREPTENAAAQVQFATKAAEFLEQLHRVKAARNFEAVAFSNWSSEDGDWELALENARLWHNDEPFAVSPAYLGAAIASVTEDYTKAIGITNSALRCNPGDAILINDLAFMYASINDIKRANEYFAMRKDKKLELASISLKATNGLIRFREGNPDHGRELYFRAIEQATAERSNIMRAAAWLMLAREELRIRSEFVLETLGEAALAVSEAATPQLRRSLRKLERDFIHAARTRLGPSGPQILHTDDEVKVIRG